MHINVRENRRGKQEWTMKIHQRKQATGCKALTHIISYTCIECTLQSAEFEFITLIDIDTDYTCSCKSNYYTITTTMITWLTTTNCNSLFRNCIFSRKGRGIFQKWKERICLTPSLFISMHNSQPSYSL